LYPSVEKYGQKHAILAKPESLQVADHEQRAYFSQRQPSLAKPHFLISNQIGNSQVESIELVRNECLTRNAQVLRKVRLYPQLASLALQKLQFQSGQSRAFSGKSCELMEPQISGKIPPFPCRAMN
jgi:hypothetical protein